jgi:hypothetical protein
MKKELMKRKLEKGEVLLEYKPRDLYVNWLTLTGGTLINKKAAIKVGGFNTESFPCADVIFVTQLAVLEGSVFVNYRKLFRYRIAVNESFNSSTNVKFAEYISVFCQYMGEKCRIVPNWVAEWHRSHKVVSCENDVYQLFVSENRANLEREFEKLNKELGIVKRGKISAYIHKKVVLLHFNLFLLFRAEYYKNQKFKDKKTDK